MFRRGDESLTCELALDDAGEYYELRTSGANGVHSGDSPVTRARHPIEGFGARSSTPAHSVERFSSVAKAFERQSGIEGRLIEEGWTLESHECILT